MKTLRHATLVLLLGAPLLAGSACDSTKVQPMANGGGTGAGGTGGPGGAGGSVGASGPGGAAGADGLGGAGGGGIPLVDWVTDLADNHTNEVSPPDTVADKNIIDTADPAAFDPLLQVH